MTEKKRKELEPTVATEKVKYKFRVVLNVQNMAMNQGIRSLKQRFP